MSVQAAKDFLKKLESDPAFKAKFQGTPNHDIRHKMAKDAGFVFTQDEFGQAVKAMTADATEKELTAEQLQAVAGGHCIIHWIDHEVHHETSSGEHEVHHEGSQAVHEAKHEVHH